MYTSTCNVLVGTPAYNGMVHCDYVRSLLDFGNAGIRYSFLAIAGESLITRARNSILSRFHAMEEFTHLLFLDGDVLLKGADLGRLLGHGRDVVGAAVALKTGREGRPVYNVAGDLGADGPLCRVERVGTAALLLSRRAGTALVEDARTAGRAYRPNPEGRGMGDPDEVFDVFQVGVRDGEYLSEDFWVCYRLRELGFDVFVDQAIRTRHHGMAAYG
jgi:hypothetical protein